MKFELDKLMKEKIAINCETKEELKQFTEILDKRRFKNKKCRYSDYVISNSFKYFSNKLCFNFDEMSLGYADDGVYIDRGYEIVKFKDLEFDKLPKLYGYLFENGILERQEVEVLKETNKYYVVEYSKCNGYKSKISKTDVNKVFYDYRHYGLFLEPDEQAFKIQVVSKLKKDVDKLYKEIDRRENDIKSLEGV